MSRFHSFVSAISAVLLGLPVLFTALMQCLTGIGYGKKPEAAVSANYLPGNASFLEEAASESWSVGFGRETLTPGDVGSHDYFVGGYLMFPAQIATGVIDDLCVRAVVLDDCSGRGAAAFAWVDCVGLMNADIKEIREKLADITGDGKLISIDVGSTHTHSGIDTQGLWGYIPNSGRDQGYIDTVVQKTADAIRTAYRSRTPGDLYYAAKACPEMFSDGRDPQVFDEKVHLFRFVPSSGGREVYIVNFGAHPTNFDADNKALSGDYIYYLEQNVAQRKNADFIFVQGAIGGGIGCNMSEANGIPQDVGKLERLNLYSDKMTDILLALADGGARVEPILNVRHAQVEIEVDNFVFKLAERAKLCNAKAYRQDNRILLTSEIGYVEIGKNVKIVEAPGEIMPELVYGGFYPAEKAFSGTDYPYAAVSTFFGPEDDVLVFGLCNDALGYFVPDNDYSASNSDGHYEETVSTGSGSASALSRAFASLICAES